VKIEKMIEEADHLFNLLPGHEYWLYQRENGTYYISTVSPSQWKKVKGAVTQQLTFIASLDRPSQEEWNVTSISPDFVENL
jgi:hypothetical protein